MEFPHSRLEPFLNCEVTISGFPIPNDPKEIKQRVQVATDTFLEWIGLYYAATLLPEDYQEVTYFEREATNMENIRFIGDLTSGFQDAPTEPAFLGFWRIDRFVRAAVSDASWVDLVCLWDQVADAQIETIARLCFHQFSARKPGQERSELARDAAMARYDSDPKQRAKQLVMECWQDWQLDRHRYDGDTAFARDMLDKFPELTSEAVITRWARAWRREQ